MSLRKYFDMKYWRLSFKILLVVIYSILSIFTYKEFLIVAPFGIFISLLNVMSFRVLLRVLGYVFIFTLISQGFFYYGFYLGQKVHIIFWILRPEVPILGTITGGGIALTVEGLYHGLIVGTKIITLTLIGLAFMSKTKASEFLPMLKKISRKLAFSVVLVFRYFPIIMNDFQNAYEGLKTRGIEKIGVIRGLKLIFKAVIINMAKRAESITIAATFRKIY